MISHEISDAEVAERLGFGLEVPPEGCVEFRYQVISIIDAVGRGAQFEGLRAKAVQPDSELAKGALIYSGRRIRPDSSVLFLGYKHDGTVELCGRGVDDSGNKDLYREFSCCVYPDKAFGYESIATISAGKTEVAHRRMKDRGLSAWRRTLDSLGEPLPTKPRGSERGLIARFLLRNS